MNKRVALFWFNLNYTCSDNIIRARTYTYTSIYVSWMSGLAWCEADGVWFEVIPYDPSVPLASEIVMRAVYK